MSGASVGNAGHTRIPHEGHSMARLRIREGMDVYNEHGNRYIGSVVRLWHGGAPQRTGGARAEEKEDRVSSVSLVHEEGHSAGHVGPQSGRTLGEQMGPVPTVTAGNAGPINQSAAHDYATMETDARSDVVYFAVRPGRINLGILTRPLYIPCSAVLSVSMERIVVALEGDRIPPAWHRRPRL